MVTKEDLQAKYAGLSNSALLEILEHKADYTELAVETVTEEIKRRNLSTVDYEGYQNQKDEKIEISYANAIIDLPVWQKGVFYIIFIPVLAGILRRALKANFYEDGSFLKLKQARYFTYTSWGAIIVAVFASMFLEVSDTISLTLWVVCFIPAYLFNEYSYKPRQLAKINRSFLGD